MVTLKQRLSWNVPGILSQDKHSLHQFIRAAYTNSFHMQRVALEVFQLHFRMRPTVGVGGWGKVDTEKKWSKRALTCFSSLLTIQIFSLVYQLVKIATHKFICSDSALQWNFVETHFLYLLLAFSSNVLIYLLEPKKNSSILKVL